MYNFILGSECHLHLHSSCLQKLIYINVSPLPVEGDVIIGRVWTCLCLRSVIYTQTEVFSRADFGGHERAGWYPMAVAPEGHNQELPIFSIFPWDPPKPRSIGSRLSWHVTAADCDLFECKDNAVRTHGSV